MGQYYLAAFLAENDGKEFIRAAINSHEFANGAKLTEHSYVGNNFISAIEYLLSNLGMFYKTRLVWAGDYADPEPNSDNLYTIAQGKEFIPSLPTSRTTWRGHSPTRSVRRELSPMQARKSLPA